ncbi:MAG: L,D-transpeptidase family protein [Rhodoferax sp.]|nr:L,D-transpeptidase family protein [Rhodoferax sp.]
MVNPKWWATLVVALELCCGTAVSARTGEKSEATQQRTASAESTSHEARLLEVYQLMAQGDPRRALEVAEKLVRDVPNFQLAQLVYGDLLAARTRTLKVMGDVPAASTNAGAAALAELKDESLRRVLASKERPAEGTLPSQFLKLSPQTRTAIAVDAGKSRLYLFTNTPSGLRLTADYYVSVGKAGTIKSQEGDQRTPLGVYYITSNLDTKVLNEFYGAGAMPLNYPNILDIKRGKSGSGIWLHGTPPQQFSRAPRSTDGCLVLSNPDILALIRRISVGTTPVVVSSQLVWMPANQLQTQARPFETALNAWREAKQAGDLNKVLGFYTADFSSYGKNLDQYTTQIRSELKTTRGKNIALKDLSYLQWSDSSETMVTTFGEVVEGRRTGVHKRQYWVRTARDWQIFFEGVI